ncbi:MAG: FtsW/RodA/SpoVE family cell cycle protein [Armatimonadota bacterium]
MPMRRQREFWLLVLVYLVLGLGYFVVWQSYLPAWRELYHGRDGLIFLPPALTFVAWALLSAALTKRRCRETLIIPLVALLIGLGLLFLLRLAGGAETLELVRSRNHPLGNLFFQLYHKQLISFALGWVVLTGVVLFWSDFRALARYKYLVAATAVGLLLVTTIFGHATHGQQLSLSLGPFSFQPHDPVKLLLVIFMAAYLVEKQELLRFAAGSRHVLTAMDLRYMGPLVVLWLMVMAIIFVHNDLGAAMLLFGSFLGILYLGTGRKSYILTGVFLSLIGIVGGYKVAQMAHLGFVTRVDTRIAIWQDPWKESTDDGYQICQALMALGNGRTIGAGLGKGYPEQIPAIETDMIYAAVSEDLGLVGAVALVGVFLALIGRMFHVGLQSRDPFGQLLAAGLAVTLAVQTWVILAGTIKFIPLTGITLPFISYGGTSLIVNLMFIGLVLVVAMDGPSPEQADATVAAGILPHT